MKRYAYYPGCSIGATAPEYEHSVKVIMDHLDMDYREIEDWNCCGATVVVGKDYLFSLLAAARNFTLVEEDTDIITPCNACLVTLNRARNVYLNEPEWREKIDEGLARVGRELDVETVEKMKVKHLLKAMVEDVGFDKLEGEVTKPLEGLRLAPYYGCQFGRPDIEGVHPEAPQVLDELLARTGSQVVDYHHKTKCCGSSLISTKQEEALRMCGELLEEAERKDVDALVATCPMCQLNVDAFQSKTNDLLGTDYNIPTLFFTQVLGLALGYSPQEMQIGKVVTGGREFMDTYKKGVAAGE